MSNSTAAKYNLTENAVSATNKLKADIHNNTATEDNINYNAFIDHNDGTIEVDGFFIISVPIRGNIRLSGFNTSALKRILLDAGIYRREVTKGEYIYIQDNANVIREIKLRDIREAIHNYIVSFGDINVLYGKNSIKISTGNATDLFRKQLRTIFISDIIDLVLEVDSRPELASEDKLTRYFYKNGVVEVGQSDPVLKDYNSISGKVVWKDDIIQEDFIPLSFNDVKNCEWAIFLSHIAGDNIRQFMTAAGYLLARYKDDSDTYAIILNDALASDPSKSMGGSGKGMFEKSIKHMCNVIDRNGKNFDASDKFAYQGITAKHDVLSIKDLKRDFDFEDLFSFLSDDIQIENKNQASTPLAHKDSPRCMISSNRVFTKYDSSNIRRQFTLQVTDFYSRQTMNGVKNPVKKEFGHLLFTGWNADEWNRFRNFMFYCVAMYWKEGMIDAQVSTVAENRLKATAGADFISFMDEREDPFAPFTNNELKKQFKQYVGDDEVELGKNLKDLIKAYAELRNLDYSEPRGTGGVRMKQLTPKIESVESAPKEEARVKPEPQIAFDSQEEGGEPGQSTVEIDSDLVVNLHMLDRERAKFASDSSFDERKVKCFYDGSNHCYLNWYEAKEANKISSNYSFPGKPCTIN